MKKLICLFFCAWVLNLCGQNINYMEYWIDTDPGFDEGIVIDDFTDDTNIMDHLLTSNPDLAPGNHLIGVRSIDSNGKWSQTALTNIVIVKQNQVEDIIAIEYFIDNDPGFGLGNSLSNSFDSEVNIGELIDSLSTTEMILGNHLIGIRSMDEDRKWSHTNFTPFQIIAEPVEEDITAIEYFWSYDPEFDNANDVVNVPVNTNISDFIFQANIPETATVGDDLQLFVRSYSNQNKWSHTQFANAIEIFPLATDTIFTDNDVCDSFISPNGTVIENDSIYNEPVFDGSQFQINTYNIQVTVIDNSVELTDNILTASSNIGTFQWLDCLNGNLPIDGATDQIYAVSQTGEYAVELTVNDCISTSDCIEVTLVSIEDLNGQTAVLYSFYPNPTKSSLHVNVTNKFQSNQLRITDLQGRIILESNLNIGLQQIDLGNLSASVYMIQFMNEKGVITQRLVIE